MQKSEEKLRILVQNLPDFIITVDVNGTIFNINRIIINKTMEEVIGTSIYDHIAAEYCYMIRQTLKRVFQTGNPETYEVFGSGPNGPETAYYQTRVIPIKKDTNVVAAILISTDITERKTAETALRESEERYKALVKASPDAIVVIDLQGNVVEVSDKTLELHGYKDLREIIGKSAFEFIAPEYHEEVLKNLRRTLREGGLSNKEYRLIRKDGTSFIGEINASLIKDSMGNPKAFITTTRDITERKKIYTALMESEERYRGIVEDQTELICRYMPDGRLTFVNEAYCRYHGKNLEELIGRNFIPDIFEDDKEIVERNIASLNKENPVVTHEHRIILSSGAIAWQQWTNRIILNEKGSVVEFQAVGRDITVLKKAELELLQAQKLASIGQLAAGVAHEINNPLSALSGEIQWLLEKEHDKKLVKSLQFVNRVSNKIAHIVDSLLTFSQETSTKGKKLSDINSLIDETLLLMERRFNLINIKVIRKFEKKLPRLRINKGQIEQVFTNVLMNCADAMPEGGKITILTKISEDKDSVEINFEDTGSGISKEIVSKIFDPFFTTCTNDKGTGLGLAVSHGIIKKHSGSIEIESKLKRGTNVNIKLPIN